MYSWDVLLSRSWAEKVGTRSTPTNYCSHASRPPHSMGGRGGIKRELDTAGGVRLSYRQCRNRSGIPPNGALQVNVDGREGMERSLGMPWGRRGSPGLEHLNMSLPHLPPPPHPGATETCLCLTQVIRPRWGKGSRDRSHTGVNGSAERPHPQDAHMESGFSVMPTQGRELGLIH